LIQQHDRGTSLEDIQNEARATKKLCGSSPHINIVHVLGQGILPLSPFYYIDMELCDQNLETYIYNRRDPQLSGEELEIWDIMRQIANGVKFIHNHGEIHRDLKPSNGMYRGGDYLNNVS
jgi:serine/threonine protein kinase